MSMSYNDDSADDSPHGSHTPYVSIPRPSSTNSAFTSATQAYLHTTKPVDASIEAHLPEYAVFCCQALTQTRGTLVRISHDYRHEFLRRCCHYVRRTARRQGTYGAIRLMKHPPYSAPWWVDQKMAFEARKGLAGPADPDEENAVQGSAESVDREILKIVLDGSRGPVRLRAPLRGMLGEANIVQTWSTIIVGTLGCDSACQLE